jgi:hypothetical protein
MRGESSRSMYFADNIMELHLLILQVLICGLGIVLMVSRVLESRAEIFYRAQVLNGRTTDTSSLIIVPFV